MAATKKTATGKSKGAVPALPVSTAAFEHGASAYGARFVKKGFGFSEQEDLEWALGWPHVRRLIDADDANAAANVEKHNPFIGVATDYPRAIAARAVRGYKDRPKSPSSKRNPDLERIVGAGGNVTPAEARSILELQLGAPDRSDLWWAFGLPKVIPLLEAFVGPEVIAEALVDNVEDVPAATLKDSGNRKRFECLLWLGFLLLRIPAAKAEKLRARLGKVLDGFRAGGRSKGELPARSPIDYAPYGALDLVLEGKAGAARTARPGAQVYPSSLLFVHDDPAFVRAQLEAFRTKGPGEDEPSARLAFLGGDEVLDVEATWWPKYRWPDKARAHRKLVQDYGRIRSERMSRIFLAMSATSKARQEATAWFAAHADYARPYLERTATGKGDAAAWAKALLG